MDTGLCPSVGDLCSVRLATNGSLRPVLNNSQGSRVCAVLRSGRYNVNEFLGDIFTHRAIFVPRQ